MTRLFGLMCRLVGWLWRRALQAASRDRDKAAEAWVFIPLGTVGMIAVAGLVIQRPLMGAVTLPLTVPLPAFCLLGGTLAAAEPVIRRRHLRRTQTYLRGHLRDERWQEVEACLIVQAWQFCSRPPRILKGRRIWWQVLHTDREGNRLLVRPLFDHRIHVLVGEDINLPYHFFFMPTDTSVRTVPGAMDWLWQLEPGTWERSRVLEI